MVQGYSIVLTRRRDRATTGYLKRTSSKCFYKVFSALAGFPIHEGASDFRLLDRAPLDNVLRFRDSTPFLRGSVELLGFPKTIVEFDVEPRRFGVSKYSPRRMLRFAYHALVAHSTIPLRIGIWIGLVTAVLAFLELGFVVLQALMGNAVAGWASTIGVNTFLFGVLFLLLGVIGVYIGEIHKILQRRPPYIVYDRKDQSFRKPPVE
jgi:polyisoprenyl-phosphate glycosyltransferase